MTTPGIVEAAILAVSIINVILMVWLGLTVLFNAERPRWGVWLTSGALLAGGAFFLAQAVVVERGLGSVSAAMYLQWPMGWFIGMVLPLAWYATMLWYAGFWQNREAPLHKRHRNWLAITVVLAAVVLVLALMAASYPVSWTIERFEPFARPAIGGVPILAVAYPAFIFLCIVLSLDVLRRPAPSQRLMGDLARRRARPWLMATSMGLLLVSCLVGVIMIAIAFGHPTLPARTWPSGIPLAVVWGDLIVSLLVAMSIVSLGQAIVAYEIFTGKTLPRHGLRRHWDYTVILAAGYGAVMGWSVAIESAPFYGLLLAALLIASLYALFNWRSYIERDRYIHHLRPFVASPRVYDALLQPGAPELDAAGPFRALCAEVLGSRLAYLVAVGPLSSLAGPPLAHPQTASAPNDLSKIITQCDSPETMCFPADPAIYAGATWAVPLWSERGLIGVLLLGEKADGGLYTQEEMEIARASGERLIDTLACARMAQRLMAMQRERLAQSQVVDRRARRVLHDEVLPELHAAMLAVREEQDNAGSGIVDRLADVHHQLSDLLRQMSPSAGSEIVQLGLMGALRRVLEDELAEAFDEVTWELDPRAEEKVQALPVLTAEVLFYAAREAIRNASRHGRGDDTARLLRLKVTVALRDGLEMIIEDDGVGFSAVQRDSATGQGMALHSTMMAVIGGGWVTDSLPGSFTRVTLSLPENGWQHPTQ